MDWDLILQWSFLVSLVTAGIRLAVPVLLAVLGEIITERAGILNLGLEGIMAVGGLAGFMAAYYLETGPHGTTAELERMDGAGRRPSRRGADGAADGVP